MTATQPTTNTLAIDTETRQISGYANWEASPVPDTIEVELAIPDGETPPYFKGTIEVKTVGDGGVVSCLSLLGSDAAWFATRVIEHINGGTDTHKVEPPLVNVPIDFQRKRTGNLWRFEANRPAGIELVLTPNFGV